jgi:hypothetical protein
MIEKNEQASVASGDIAEIFEDDHDSPANVLKLIWLHRIQISYIAYAFPYYNMRASGNSRMRRGQRNHRSATVRAVLVDVLMIKIRTIDDIGGERQRDDRGGTHWSNYRGAYTKLRLRLLPRRMPARTVRHQGKNVTEGGRWLRHRIG